MRGPVHYERDNSIAIITMDDGKANALGPVMISEINAALDRAEKDNAGAVVLAGNDRVFSGGFDLKVMGSGDVNAVIEMLTAGFTLSHRLLSFPRPVIAACTGPAVAMGSFLVCSADHRIAAPAYTFVANEVELGMVLPYPALQVLKLRLTPSAYQQAVGLAKVFFGEKAIAAGWIDEIDLPDVVLRRAHEAGQTFAALDAHAHHASKIRTRRHTLDAMQRDIDALPTEFGVGT